MVFTIKHMVVLSMIPPILGMKRGKQTNGCASHGVKLIPEKLDFPDIEFSSFNSCGKPW